MTAQHNHPPRCCCFAPPSADPDADVSQSVVCPGCIEHGQFAASGIVCPQCKAEIGRPHTDYCTLAPGAVWDGAITDTGTVFIDDSRDLVGQHGPGADPARRIKP